MKNLDTAAICRDTFATAVKQRKKRCGLILISRYISVRKNRCVARIHKTTSNCDTQRPWQDNGRRTAGREAFLTTSGLRIFCTDKVSDQPAAVQESPVTLSFDTQTPDMLSVFETKTPWHLRNNSFAKILFYQYIAPFILFCCFAVLLRVELI